MKPVKASLIALGAAVVGAFAPAPAVAQAPAKQPPPPPLEARPIRFPEFNETTLPNGLRVMVVQNRRLPVANVNLYLESGSANDPAGKQGLASLTADLLDNGTARRSAKQIAETIEGVGGTLNTGADQLELAFDMVSDVALRPTFPADELETTRRQQLSALQVALGDAGQIAQRRFNREVYGAEHPYGVAPSPETVRAVTRDDLVQFHRAHFTPSNALLVVSGDVTPQQVRELAARYFGSWQGGKAPEPSLAAPAMRDRANVVLVHRPGSVQSSIRVGHPGITPDNPDYYAVQVLNAVLGSLPTSRLEKTIRGQRAWTYSARSTFTRPEGTGVFVGNMEVRTPVTDSALVEMLAQFRRIRDERVPQAELDAAKSYLTGSFPLRFETPAATAAQLAQLRLLGLPTATLQQFRERVAAVTAEDVQRVAQKYVHPERATVVVVGDATQVLKPLEAVGTITLYDVEGKPLDRSALVAAPAAAAPAAAAPAAAPTAASAAGAPAADAADQGVRLQPVTLTYAVTRDGSLAGTSVTTLTREGNVWKGVNALDGGPGSISTEVRFTNAMAPVSTGATINGMYGRQFRVEVSYANGRMKGQADLPEQLGGARAIDVAVEPGTQFTAMTQWVLAVADLAPRKVLSHQAFSAMSGAVSRVTLTVLGEEKVTVPAGTFDAYKVQMAGGPIAGIVWVRKAAPHWVLKQGQGGDEVILDLQSMK